MTQQIIVYLIGVAVLVYIVWHLVRLFSGRGNPCSSCGGCELHDACRQRQPLVGAGPNVHRSTLVPGNDETAGKSDASAKECACHRPDTSCPNCTPHREVHVHKRNSSHGI